MQTVVSACPINDVMRVLSGRWPTLLIYYLKDRPKRFSDLRRDNPTISHRMLTLELRKLEQAGIVERDARDGFPLHVEYRLSPIGWELVPLIDALAVWWEGARPRRSAAEGALAPDTTSPPAASPLSLSPPHRSNESLI